MRNNLVVRCERTIAVYEPLRGHSHPEYIESDRKADSLGNVSRGDWHLFAPWILSFVDAVIAGDDQFSRMECVIGRRVAG